MKNKIEIIKEFARQVKGILGEDLVQVILYGSYARGDYRENSDIDIMILVDTSLKDLKSYEDKLTDVSVDFALEYLKVFSLIDVCYAEFSKWKQVLPFYRNVAKEGVVLYAA